MENKLTILLKKLQENIGDIEKQTRAFNNAFQSSNLEYLFDAIPENQEAMRQLRQFQTEKNTIEYNGKIVPCSYLSLRYKNIAIVKAVNYLSKELQFLAKEGYILGALCMPKKMDTSLPDFDWHSPAMNEANKNVSALYCFPFLNLEKIEKDFNKNIENATIGIDHNVSSFLNLIGVNTAGPQGISSLVYLGYTDEEIEAIQSLPAYKDLPLITP